MNKLILCISITFFISSKSYSQKDSVNYIDTSSQNEEEISIGFSLVTDTITKLKTYKRRPWQFPELMGVYEIFNHSTNSIQINNTIGYEDCFCEFYLEIMDSAKNEYKDENWGDDIDYFNLPEPRIISSNDSYVDTLNFFCYRFTHPGKYLVRLVYNQKIMSSNQNYIDYDLKKLDLYKIKSNWTCLVVKE